MTYIPDVREDDNYNQKYLSCNDKEYVNGYDYAVEDVLESFFDNIDDFDFDVDGEDYDIGKILSNHPAILEKFKEVLKFHFESERDSMVTSMIDNYSDEEYSAIRTKVDGKPYKEV